MRAARQLLRGSDLPGARVAERCGYRRPDQFAVAFKRAEKVTPGRYRHEKLGP